jgi:hypothetical protein
MTVRNPSNVLIERAPSDPPSTSVSSDLDEAVRAMREQERRRRRPPVPLYKAQDMTPLLNLTPEWVNAERRAELLRLGATEVDRVP